jgi:uncharacterized protein YcfJ
MIDKSMMGGIAIGVVVAAAGGAMAGYNYNLIGNKEPAYAQVLKVTEATQTIQVPREVCEDIAVTQQQPVKDEKRIVGTVAGALLGGVLGNQVGGGSGKKIATVAGAAAGGYAGNKVQQNMQAKDTYTTIEKRCHSVNESKVKSLGYDVSYQLGDETGSVRMDHRPGERIPVKDGQLVLIDSAAPVTGTR